MLSYRITGIYGSYQICIKRFIQCIIGNVPEKESNYDLISVLMLRLGSADEACDKPILRLYQIIIVYI